MGKYLPLMKHEGLSYPTHFLKIGIVASGIIFLDAEQNKSTYLCGDGMFFIHYSLQKKQNVYPKSTFRASVATQFMVKLKKKSQKVLFLMDTNSLLINIFHFLMNEGTRTNLSNLSCY